VEADYVFHFSVDRAVTPRPALILYAAQSHWGLQKLHVYEERELWTGVIESEEQEAPLTQYRSAAHPGDYCCQTRYGIPTGVYLHSPFS
jgi:hypothetical protein